MGALKYLDPFPVLVVAGVVLITASTASFVAPPLSETIASALVLALLVALLVAGGLWLREAFDGD